MTFLSGRNQPDRFQNTVNDNRYSYAASNADLKGQSLENANLPFLAHILIWNTCDIICVLFDKAMKLETKIAWSSLSFPFIIYKHTYKRLLRKTFADPLIMAIIKWSKVYCDFKEYVFFGFD